MSQPRIDSPLEAIDLAAHPAAIINAVGLAAGRVMAEWIRLELRREKALLGGARTSLDSMESHELSVAMTRLYAASYDASLMAAIEESPDGGVATLEGGSHG